MSTIAARRWARRVALLLPTMPAEDTPAMFGPGHNAGPDLAPVGPAPMTLAALTAAIGAMSGREEVKITFGDTDPALECGAFECGELMTVGRRFSFLMVRRPGSPMGTVSIGPLQQMAVLSIEIVRTHDEVEAERNERRLGVRVLDRAPATRDEYVAAFEQLADAVAAEPIGARRRQVEHQLDDLAESIGLSKAKRLFLVTEAAYRRKGEELDPTQLQNFYLRASMDQPLPQDFDPDPAIRKDRKTRQALRMANPLNAELAFMLRRMRRARLDARRPHNAPYLLVRFAMKHGKDASFAYDPGKGLKRPTIDRVDPDSKTARRRESQAQRRPEYAALVALMTERRAELAAARATPAPAEAPIAAPYVKPTQLSLF